MSGSGSEGLLEIIGKWMEKYLDGDTQTGVALSMVLGGEAAQYWNGLANRKEGTTVDLDTLFVIASVQKVFTSTLCAVRIVNGKMQLPDAVTKYLPARRGQGRACDQRSHARRAHHHDGRNAARRHKGPGLPTSTTTSRPRRSCRVVDGLRPAVSHWDQ